MLHRISRLSPAVIGRPSSRRVGAPHKKADVAHLVASRTLTWKHILPLAKTSFRWSSSSASQPSEPSLKSNSTSSTELKSANSSKEPTQRPKLEQLKQLAELARPEWKTLMVALAALGVSSGTTLILPAAMGRIIDMLTKVTTTPAEVQLVMGGLLGMFFIGSVAAYYRYTLLNYASQRIVARIRTDLFRSLMRQEVAFFDERKTGELVNRLSADSEIMSKSLLDNFSSGLRRAIEGIGGLTVLFYLAPKLTLTMLAVVPPVFLGAMFYGKSVKKLSTQVTDALAMATSLAEEKLASIRTVRSFSQEPREIDSYAAKVQSVLKLANQVAKVSGTFFSGAFFAVNFAMLAVLYHGATIVLSGQMTAGDLTSFLLYAVYVGFAFSGVGSFYGELMRSLGSSERVLNLIERAPKQVTTGLTLKHLEGSISFKDVEFTYPTRPGQPILKGFSLDLTPGSVVAIVGHSGSGKSTIFSLLTRLYEPNAGTILVDGVPISDMDANWLRHQFGVVPQDVSLFATTIRENIAYGNPEATDAEIEWAAREASAHDFISAFPEGYSTQVGERGVTLSGGQKQRIAIARALLKNPKVLLLDEATSSLDTESEYLIQQALQRLMKHRTVLIIAHRLSTIKNADKIAVLVNGTVEELGTFDELMANKGYFKALVDRQDY